MYLLNSCFINCSSWGLSSPERICSFEIDGSLSNIGGYLLGFLGEKAFLKEGSCVLGGGELGGELWGVGGGGKGEGSRVSGGGDLYLITFGNCCAAGGKLGLAP